MWNELPFTYDPLPFVGIVHIRTAGACLRDRLIKWNRVSYDPPTTPYVNGVFPHYGLAGLPRSLRVHAGINATLV